MNQIITSILDTDSYKISMMQAVFHQYPKVNVKYVFKCRNKDIKLGGSMIPDIKEQVEAMANVSLTKQEKEFLSDLPFIKSDYLDYLEKYRFDPSQVRFTNINGEMGIEIVGLWVDTILWEVPLLAIINQIYFKKTSEFNSIKGMGEQILRDKINIIRQYPTFNFIDFGTRRRYSKDWQKQVVETLHKNCPQLIGTSNVKLAMDLDIKAVGSVAHEWTSAHIALTDNIREAQKRALYVWVQEYGKELGIALTDTFTTRAFYQDFNYNLANIYSGVRQDSGDPIAFGRGMIQHYKDLGIDPKTKHIIFSDGLDIPDAIKIYKEFVGLIGISFGIGTSLTNSLGVTPLNIVIKLVECNGMPVVKLSDNEGKAIGDVKVIERIKKAYNI